MCVWGGGAPFLPRTSVWSEAGVWLYVGTRVCVARTWIDECGASCVGRRVKETHVDHVDPACCVAGRCWERGELSFELTKKKKND